MIMNKNNKEYVIENNFSFFFTQHENCFVA